MEDCHIDPAERNKNGNEERNTLEGKESERNRERVIWFSDEKIEEEREREAKRDRDRERIEDDKEDKRHLNQLINSKYTPQFIVLNSIK